MFKEISFLKKSSRGPQPAQSKEHMALDFRPTLGVEPALRKDKEEEKQYYNKMKKKGKNSH